MRLTSKALTRVWFALATAVAAGLPAVAPAVAAAPSTPGAPPHAVGGYLPSPVLTSAKTRLGDASAFEVLPEAVDLRKYAPPVGDQGQIGSCVAWTVGYSIMGYYANRAGGTGAPYAPLFLYMRNVARNGAPTAGLNPDAVLTSAQTAGVDTQEHYWQGTTNWQSPPTQEEIDNARDYRVNGWSRLFVGGNQGSPAQTLIKQTLASGRPVALSMPVYEDFMYLRGHSLYDTLTGSSLGGHMIAAYGYDEQGVTIRNSWGTHWGNGGDAKLSWAFINKAASSAYAVDGIATPARVAAPPAPAITSITPNRGFANARTAVVVTGVNFTDSTRLTVGGVGVAYTKVSATQVRVTLPVHKAGAVDIRLTTPGGVTAPGASSRFTYRAPVPVIRRLSVTKAALRTATPVRITGSGFTGATRVTVGGVATTFMRVSDTEIRMTLKARTRAGSAPVVVTAAGGRSAAAAFAFVARRP
ncbi:IPT/TIG domain-containing protein [Actinoplanes sp. NPDC049668]|uniref:IPT/TIG domain-containing protein n=1 Tax=unclassified Actinoplanes TaxID=2626549 RepID=UPI0033A50055